MRCQKLTAEKYFILRTYEKLELVLLVTTGIRFSLSDYYKI